jgi:hypothetical protein
MPVSSLSRELGITLGDAWMLYDVYSVYYAEPPDIEALAEMLESAGLTLAGAGGVYAGLRLFEAVMVRTARDIPLAGRIFAALITGAITFGLGLMWQTFLEETYRGDSHGQAAPIPVTTTADVPERSEGKQQVQIASARRSIARPGETITTERPDGKPGATVPKAAYDLVRATIMDLLRNSESISLQEIIDAVEAHSDQLDKSARWYANTVKFDLETHGVIERVPGESPQQLRLLQAT